MNTPHAVGLGLLQGLGEFLPISSSGHLNVVPWPMGWPDSGLAFDVALHLGTLAAVFPDATRAGSHRSVRDPLRLGNRQVRRSAHARDGRSGGGSGQG